MAEIHERIEAELPSLRRYARALIRNVVAAAAPHLSQPGNQEKRLELSDFDRALGQLPAEQRS